MRIGLAEDSRYSQITDHITAQTPSQKRFLAPGPAGRGRHFGSGSRISGESTVLVLLVLELLAQVLVFDLGLSFFNACWMLDRLSEQPIHSCANGEMSSVEN